LRLPCHAQQNNQCEASCFDHPEHLTLPLH
jgi:hypothetical protein